jgi:hypothetical protein
MGEVGLLPFARVALQVSKAVLPRCRSRFSKRQFNQPQLLAILCLNALRGPGLSRGRGLAERASRTPSGAGAGQRARLHNPVSFPAVFVRCDQRPSGQRDRASVARGAQKRPTRSPRWRRGSSWPVLARADRATRSLEQLCEFAPVVQAASQQTLMGWVLADVEFDSERIIPTSESHSAHRV